MVSPCYFSNYGYNNFYSGVQTQVPQYSQPALTQGLPQYNRLQNYNYSGYFNQYQPANAAYYTQPINYTYSNLNNNIKLAESLLNEFNSQYPNLESFTMSELRSIKAQKYNPHSIQTTVLKGIADRDFEKMISYLNKRPDQRLMTFDEYLAMIKQEFATYNMGNCGERAYILHDRLNKTGIKNQAVIEISGNKNYNNHVFNVIGLAPDAVFNKPETWGPDAIVVDAWSNRIMKPQEAFNFYNHFFEYGQNNPMKVDNLDITKLFKPSVQTY